MKKNLTVTTALTLSLIATAMMPNNASAQPAEQIDQLMGMSLKDLVDMKVTSVSKQEEKASEAAAAIYVITKEDLKRIGATSVPEALRIVPGMQVSRINSSVWAISSRGFASDFANKLLVVIDGRSVYNPMFSGVLWDEQGVPVEEIERIEVIRGPGATLWGANAVNGIINIITKHSADSQGTRITAGAGTYENAFTTINHGGKISDKANYKAYVQYFDQDNSKFVSSNDEKDDEFNIGRAGFKVDSEINESSELTVQGDIFRERRHEGFDLFPTNIVDGGVFVNPTIGFVSSQPDEHHVGGGNLLAKYTKSYDDDSQLDLQAYFDNTHRAIDILEYNINTVDFDSQYAFQAADSHEVIVGLGYRSILVDIRDSTTADFANRDLEQTLNLYSGFIQDKIELSDNELYLTLGSKFEHNTFTGFEIQPNARLSWLISDEQTLWGAVTRAVRTPSIADRTISQNIASAGAAFVTFNGNDGFDSEEVYAYELGYRFQPTEDSSIDIAAFVNEYNDLRSYENNGFALATPLDNKSSGVTKGIEIAGNWQVSNEWNLIASYSYIDLDIHLDRNSIDTGLLAVDDRSPTSMFNVRSHYDINEDWSMDNIAYYVGAMDNIGVDEYLRFDTQVSYKPMDDVEISLVGQNLLDGQHQEFTAATYNTAAEIPRAVYGKVSVRF